MCFSPTASFGAGAVLLTIGCVTIKKAKTTPQTVLAFVPVLFALQQISEGFVWLALMHTAYAYWLKPATYAFLLFAQVVWPFYVPLAVMLVEKDVLRKEILSILLMVGVFMALYLAYCLANYPVHASIDVHHIRYDLDFPGANGWFSPVFYFIPTAISPFVSKLKRVRLLGAAIILSYIVTRIFYQYYVISVWCYFAAIMSLIILSIIQKLRKEPTVGV